MIFPTVILIFGIAVAIYACVMDGHIGLIFLAMVLFYTCGDAYCKNSIERDVQQVMLEHLRIRHNPVSGELELNSVAPYDEALFNVVK